MAQVTATTVRELAEGWIGALEAALQQRDGAAFADLFLKQSYWRDLVAFTWDTRQFWGRDEVGRRLFEYSQSTKPSDFRLDPHRSAPRVQAEAGTAEFFFAFETTVGTGSAFVSLALNDDAQWGMRARLIGTTLTGLHRQPLPQQSRRGYEPGRPGETWDQYRRRIKELANRDPDVLVVGGGQSGVTLAERLERRGVSYVVIDKHKRPGDSWRERYSSLALHTPTCANNLPDAKLPGTSPTFLSKDQWAAWIDAYADFMDLNYWNCTEFISGTFDDDNKVWAVELKTENGSVRMIHPKHLVMAVGMTGTDPVIPELPGLGDFAAQVVHSSKFDSGENYRGKKVLVVGTATSAHDIALDLYHNDATVYMAQRGPACVVSISEAERYNLDYLSPAWSEEEVDQRRNSGFVYPLVLAKLRAETRRTEREFADTFDGLRKAGLTLTIGEDKAGWLMKLHRTFSGYYLDVGASQVIIDRGITVLQIADVEQFVPTGMQMADGSVIELDAIILATGYHNMHAVIERMLGLEVADKVGIVGGIGEDGEPRNMARPTGQAHLWFIFGGIMDSRKMSDLLALQIVAQLRSIAPTLVRGPGGGVYPLELLLAEDTEEATA